MVSIMNRPDSRPRPDITGDSEEPRPSGFSTWVRFLSLVAFLVIGGAVVVAVGLPDVQQLREYIAGAGPAAPALFIVVYAILTLLPLPKNVMGAVAGLLFGLVLGIILVLIAAILGAAAAFLVSRALGRDAVERLIGARVAKVDELLHQRGIVAVIVLRLIPVLPFTALNYAAGLTSVRTRDYAIGTMIGIIPGTVAFVTLGTYSVSPRSWPFLVSAAALALLTVGGYIVARRSRQNRHHTAT